MHVACTSSLDEAVEYVRAREALDTVVVADEKGDEVTLLGVSRIAACAPELPVVVLAQRSSLPNMVKYLRLGQRGDGRSSVDYCENTYDYDSLESMILAKRRAATASSPQHQGV